MLVMHLPVTTEPTEQTIPDRLQLQGVMQAEEAQEQAPEVAETEDGEEEEEIV
jgi:hypothetical protein